MGRVYATPEEYETYTGQPPPERAAARLARASAFLESRVLRLCRYDVDEAGMPTHPLVVAAARDAVCAQLEWWEAVGDDLGADAAGWSTVEIGSAKLARPTPSSSGEDTPARQIAPQVLDIFRAPDLTLDILQIGAVSML
ncbi:hypothetical protein ABZ820_34655 [Streptomyces diacarni]|uniref:hypothetical protein n=1 Tax=Streptomyces diacarni TaxID=2800381 RepID=UPI0033FADF2B